MANSNSATVKRINEYIQSLEDLDLLMGSIEVISIIQDKSQEERKKFFEFKNELAITKNRLRMERLEKIAFKLENLENQFKNGIENVNNELENIGNISEALKLLDTLLGVVARIFL
jgi:microsomal dipeptidase-like Zn-dependent dipeptidase